MKKNFSIDGVYQVNGNEEQEFEIKYDNLPENEEGNNRLILLLNHPWRLIKEGGKLGVNGAKRFFTVLALFSISNTILFFFALIRLFSTDFEIEKLAFLFLVFLLGIGFTIYSAYRTYQYVIIETIRVIYENLSSFFKKISDLTIDRADRLFHGKDNVSNKQLAKALNFSNLINSKFKKLPKILRIGIVHILNLVPLSEMIIDLKEDIRKGNKSEASTKLYNKMDNFIFETIFEGNSTNWVWWLLPLNIVILVLVIILKIG